MLALHRASLLAVGVPRPSQPATRCRGPRRPAGDRRLTIRRVGPAGARGAHDGSDGGWARWATGGSSDGRSIGVDPLLSRLARPCQHGPARRPAVTRGGGGATVPPMPGAGSPPCCEAEQGGGLLGPPTVSGREAGDYDCRQGVRWRLRPGGAPALGPLAVSPAVRPWHSLG